MMEEEKKKKQKEWWLVVTDDGEREGERGEEGSLAGDVGLWRFPKWIW